MFVLVKRAAPARFSGRGRIASAQLTEEGVSRQVRLGDVSLLCSSRLPHISDASSRDISMWQYLMQVCDLKAAVHGCSFTVYPRRPTMGVYVN